MQSKQIKIKKFDVVSFIVDYEEGNLNDDQIIEGFQYLVDNNLIGHLQGHYQRMASHLLGQDIIKRKNNAKIS